MFGAGSEGPVFLSEVDCTGAEDELTLCQSVGIGYHMCSRLDTAGVTCNKTTSNIHIWSILQALIL